MRNKKYILPGVGFFIAGIALVSCGKVEFNDVRQNNKPMAGFETVDSRRGAFSGDPEGVGFNGFHNKSNAFDPPAHLLKSGNDGTGNGTYKSGISDSEDLGESGMTKNKPKTADAKN